MSPNSPPPLPSGLTDDAVHGALARWFGHAAFREGQVDAIRAALQYLPNSDLDYDSWVRIGMAIKGALGDDGRWQVRLWWKPFVTLIWLGGGMIATGGALSLLGHWWRARRQRRAAAALAEAWA